MKHIKTKASRRLLTAAIESPVRKESQQNITNLVARSLRDVLATQTQKSMVVEGYPRISPFDLTTKEPFKTLLKKGGNSLVNGAAHMQAVDTLIVMYLKHREATEKQERGIVDAAIKLAQEARLIPK